MATKMATRTTYEVFNDHLHLREQGRIEEDLERNYAEDAVLLTGYGIFSGHDGIRVSAEILDQQLKGARYMYRTRLVHGKMAFLEWGAGGERMYVSNGADSYFIADGRIRVQTIHYTLLSTPCRHL